MNKENISSIVIISKIYNHRLDYWSAIAFITTKDNKIFKYKTKVYDGLPLYNADFYTVLKDLGLTRLLLDKYNIAWRHETIYVDRKSEL